MKKTVLVLMLLIGAGITVNAQNLNKTSLCKKWYLNKYEVFWVDYAPDANEKNDYILLNPDMTYESVDAGEKSTGKWKFDNNKKIVTLFGQNSNESLNLYIQELSKSKMMFNLKIQDMENVDIHYSTAKK